MVSPTATPIILLAFRASTFRVCAFELHFGGTHQNATPGGNPTAKETQQSRNNKKPPVNKNAWQRNFVAARYCALAGDDDDDGDEGPGKLLCAAS